VAPTPPPPPPDPRLPLVARERERAEALERAGRLRQALDRWKIALTIKPDDAPALEGKARLEARIEQGIGEQVRLGREALQRGDHLEARRHFLAVLALDPANQSAFRALQNEVKEVRFVPHTVRAGESLASIAERYYGDRARSEVIWEVNQLPPNPRLAPGTQLRIPEIPGVPFIHERPRPPAEPAPRVATPAPEATGPEAGRADAPRPDAAREETPRIDPMLAEAREAMEKGDFAVALADVDRFLSGNAQSAEGLDLKKQVLYGLGKVQLGQRRYDESYRTLNQLARLAPDYRDSASLLREARERLIQHHYTQGLRLFREEKLEQAIAEWRIVLDYDPQHANARRNLDQAERLLRNLQQRQQPQPPQQAPPGQPPRR
jgi:tetratricopeptide (TPR) repeat protein